VKFIIPEPIVGGIFCIMFGMISAFGNSKDRGLDAWAKEMELTDSKSEKTTDGVTDGDEYVWNTFDFPFGMNLMRRWKWTSYVPFLPTSKRS
ncbi:hypothetical protein X777_06254, partial [Ooceraea biroi]